MICFAREFLGRWRRPIRLRMPSRMVLVTGARRERIHAVFDEQDRITVLVVHTRQRLARPRTCLHRRF